MSALLIAVVLLSVLLLPQGTDNRKPRQEYENDDIKKSLIVFSEPSGFYSDAFTLEIQSPTKEIYYTLDGTDPVRGQEGTFRYDGGIEISDPTARENVHSMRTDVTTAFDTEMLEEYSNGERPMNYRVPDYPVDKCTIVRAAFYTPEGTRSDIETGTFFVGYDGREGYGDTRVISIVTDPANLFDHETGIYVTGKSFDDFVAADSFHDGSIWYRHIWWWWDANYHNSGREWERQANVQFFDKDGSLLLQQEAGIRIQGGGSRGFLPKSLNLYARKDYDGNSSFHYDFFDTGYQAKRLTLTTCGDDCYTKQKDRLVSELAADRSFSTMHYMPCMVFLDGEFWGFYYLTEKYDEKYFSYYYDVPEDEILEIKNNEIEVGTEEDLELYREMKSFIEESDMSEDENYTRACELIDMDSFINYYAALIYCARCGDWPHGNFALWRTRKASVPTKEAAQKTGISPYYDGRWRWILFDVNSAAISPALQEHDTLKYVLKNKNMKMFSSLWANPQFRETFSERILEYGQTIFSPDTVGKMLDSYEEQMKIPMGVHFRRFFGEDSGIDFSEITKTEIRDFFDVRYSVVKKMLEEHVSE